MNKAISLIIFLLVLQTSLVLAQEKQDNKIRVIAIFAHPDDGDYKMGGTAALLAKLGVAVKFVSVTNGDAGHNKMGGGVLAQRRREEAKQASIPDIRKQEFL